MKSEHNSRITENGKIGDLMVKYRGSSKAVSKRALKKLVTMGSALRDVLSLTEYHETGDLYPLNEIADAINGAVSGREIACVSLAKVIEGPGPSLRNTAVRVGRMIVPPHPAVLQAIIRMLGMIGHFDDKTRREAAGALGDFRMATPGILKALTSALLDRNIHVAEEAGRSLDLIRELFPSEVKAAVAELPDLEEYARLMGDLESYTKGGDRTAGKLAQKNLVRMATPIRNILAAGGPLDYDGIAEAVIEYGSSDTRVYTNLADAIIGPVGNIRRRAIGVCREIVPLPRILVQALSEALDDRRTEIRIQAANTIEEMRLSDPQILKKIASALSDPDPTVVGSAIEALASIGIFSREVGEGLVRCLEVEGYGFSSAVLLAIKDINIFDKHVLDSVRRFANRKFVYEEAEPEGRGEDHEYWEECKQNAERRHCEARELAIEILSLPDLKMADEVSGSSDMNSAASIDDKNILAWFKEVSLKKYLRPLQVFWCIGYVDSQNIQSEGLALGWKNLRLKLIQSQITYKFARLQTSVGYLKNTCLPKMEEIFNNEPFYSHALSEEERDLKFRLEDAVGEREHGRWSAKARTAWRCVDRFFDLESQYKPSILVADLPK